MLVGVDFDNTLVCYDGLFLDAARRRRWIEPEFQGGKQQLRDELRRRGRERVWTELQGVVYGKEIRRAPPFEGALAFVDRLCGMGTPPVIVSHKTRRPVIGPAHDLRRAALDWLAAQGFLAQTRLSNDRVYFADTKEEKLTTIAQLGCTHFIDDLPEFLAEPDFPQHTARILFDPRQLAAPRESFAIVRSWREAAELLAPAAS